MVQFYLLPSPPPGNPGDKSSPSVPGVGNCLKPSCPGERGAGQIENNFLLFPRSSKVLLFKLLNECAFDAYLNSWRSSQTKIYFFCERIYVYTKTT